MLTSPKLWTELIPFYKLRNCGLGRGKDSPVGPAPTQTQAVFLSKFPMYPPLHCAPEAESPGGGHAREGTSTQAGAGAGCQALWDQGSDPGARAGQERAWWKGTQGVCPEPHGQPGAWRGACASVTGIGTQRYEDPGGFSRLGGVGVAPSSVVLPAFGPLLRVGPFLPDPR